ncbi:hypothetical protein PQX77_002721, partial [Marasmius sp. AFHP31]
MLTVYEAILFAACLRLPEGISDVEKQWHVDQRMENLGISYLMSTQIGYGAEASGRNRGISSGEMRRVSIGLELIDSPDVLMSLLPVRILFYCFGGRSLNSACLAPYYRFGFRFGIESGERAMFDSPRSVEFYGGYYFHPSAEAFDTILVLSHGHALYSGPGALAPIDYLANSSADVPRYQQGCNVADYLLEVASDPPLSLLQSRKDRLSSDAGSGSRNEKPAHEHLHQDGPASKEEMSPSSSNIELVDSGAGRPRSRYATTFLTQLEYLSGREWKILRSPTAWLLSGFLFDVIPLRIVQTVIVSTITYWMAGLSHNAANYFEFLFILVLYTLAMTLFNFLLSTLFHNGGIAILLSSLTALYQMTYAGFFVHLNVITPVLRWLQRLCPLKYCLEAMAVNEVGSGLMIQDMLQGVPVNVSASLIMHLLFGFGSNNYYRDVLVLFAFIAGFG